MEATQKLQTNTQTHEFVTKIKRKNTEYGVIT